MAVDKDVVAMFGGKTPKYTVSINPSTNQPMIVGRDEKGNVVQYFLYVDTKGNFDISPSLDTVVKKYTADFKAAGTTQAVWDAMLASGDITKKEHDTKDPAGWYKGLSKYVSSFGVGQVDAANAGAKAFTPFITWFKKSGGSSSSTGTSKTSDTVKSTYTSTQAEADNELNLFYMEQLGRNATLDERKDYLAQLNAEEKRLASTRTTTTTSTSTSGTSASSRKSTETQATAGPGGTNQADRTRIMTGVLAKSVKNTSVEDLMRGTGQIAQNISDLQAYAGEYGLSNYTADMAKKNISDKLSGGSLMDQATVDGEKMNIRAMAKVFYPTLSGLIDQGVRISSIAGIYTNEMQKILELPSSSINWASDQYISKALQNKGMDGTSQGKEGALNLNDFAIMLRNDPRWSKTQNAREEASSYANSILRSFGLAG